jgi:hypothetical protein
MQQRTDMEKGRGTLINTSPGRGFVLDRIAAYAHAAMRSGELMSVSGAP